MREQAEGTSLWRRSGALRWTVYLLLIFVVPQSILWVTLDTINRRNVERKLQVLRDAGQPVTMSELAPAPVPDDQNAAVLYQQVFRIDYSSGGSTNSSLLEATGHSKLIESEFSYDGSKAAEARVVLNDPSVISILETLEQASLRPECVFPLRYDGGWSSILTRLSQVRQAARWLSRKARICTMDGDPDEALRWFAVLFRMSDHTAQEPAPFAQLVAITIQRIGLPELERTLSETTPSPEATQDLLDCLERLDVKEHFNRALPSERATGIDTYERFRHPHQKDDWWTGFRSFPVTRLGYCYRFEVLRPLYYADLSKYLTRMDEEIGRSARVPAPPEPPPTPQRRRPFGLDLKLTQLVDILYYSGSMFGRRDTAIMEIDIARVAVALTLYEIERGEYPATLEELQMGIAAGLLRGGADDISTTGRWVPALQLWGRPG